MSSSSSSSTSGSAATSEDSYARFRKSVDLFSGNLIKSYPALEKKLAEFVDYYKKALEMNPFVLFLMAKGFVAGYPKLNSVEKVREAIMGNDPVVRNLFGVGEFPLHLVWTQSDAENKKIILSSMGVLYRRAENLMTTVPPDLDLDDLHEMVQNVGVINMKVIDVNVDESVDKLGLAKKDADAAKNVMKDITNSVKGGQYDIMGAVEKICVKIKTGEVDGDSLYTIIGTLMSKISSREEEEEESDEVEDEDVD